MNRESSSEVKGWTGNLISLFGYYGRVLLLTNGVVGVVDQRCQTEGIWNKQVGRGFTLKVSPRWSVRYKRRGSDSRIH